MPLLLPCALSLFLALQNPLPVDQVWEDVVLDNGIRVALVNAPHAAHQVVFTILPWGLLDDEAGQLQRSHLAEHILVHSADPTSDVPEVNGVLRNGETMSLSMRLETFAKPDDWRAGLERHARWLSVGQSDSELLSRILERERGAVRAEVANSSASGFSHKWAVASWNQVVRHGASDVSISGDVNSVEWGPLFADLSRRVRSGTGVQMVSVGPVDREEQKVFFAKIIGSLPARSWKASVPSVSPAQITAVADREATWDIDSVQYMSWYLMPDESALDRVAADALSAVVNARLRQRGVLLQDEINAFSSADLVTPEGRWLLISATIPVDLPLAPVVALINEVVDGLTELPEARVVIDEMERQLGTWPDFDALRRQAAGQPNLRWIEASQALFMIYAQLNMGLHRHELLRAYEGLTTAVLEEIVQQYLVPDKRSTLILRPRT
jgi:predicted Zn-dependent peptidase